MEIDGKDVTKLKISERSKLIGTVLQNADEQIIYDLVNEEIAFGCENLNIASEEIDRRIERFTTLMQIEKKRKNKNTFRWSKATPDNRFYPCDGAKNHYS